MFSKSNATSGKTASTDGAKLETVSVVIAAMDEAVNLPIVLPKIPSWVHEVILVDGNSKDDTVAVAKRVMPSIRIIQQEGRGKGAALRTGVNNAIGDIVVLLDADGSTDPAEIPIYVSTLLAGADFAKGSRFLQGAGTTDMPRFRQFGNWCLVAMTNVFFGTHYSDITYGYNAFWRRDAHYLALDIDGWACEVVNNIRAAKHKLHIVEVASFEHERLGGEAKLRTFSAGWTILTAILRERFGAERKTRVNPERVVAAKRSAFLARYFAQNQNSSPDLA